MTERVETLFDLTENNFSTLGVSSQLIYLSGLSRIACRVDVFRSWGTKKCSINSIVFMLLLSGTCAGL